MVIKIGVYWKIGYEKGILYLIGLGWNGKLML
jgi:hypothetical protein